MEKKFNKTSFNELEKVVLSAKISENLEGKKVSLEEMLDSIERNEIKLTKEEMKELKKRFS